MFERRLYVVSRAAWQCVLGFSISPSEGLLNADPFLSNFWVFLGFFSSFSSRTSSYTSDITRRKSPSVRPPIFTYTS